MYLFLYTKNYLAVFGLYYNLKIDKYNKLCYYKKYHDMSSLSLGKLNKYIIYDDLNWSRIAGIHNSEREFAMDWLEKEPIGTYIEVKVPKNRCYKYKLYYFVNEKGFFKLSAIPIHEWSTHEW